MPAKAGIQNYLKILDYRLRGNDVKGGFRTFYEISRCSNFEFVSYFEIRYSDLNRATLR